MYSDSALPSAADTGPTEVSRGGSARPIADLSIVIPVRDDAEFLARCLEAIAAQTVGPREVIVVDNDSSDETARVAQQAGARVVTQTEVGIPISSATGYDAAQGRVIARLDADSVPDPRWVENVLAVFAEHPDAAAVTGSGVLETDDGDQRPHASRAYLGAYFALTRLAIAHEPVFGSAMAIRRWAWQRISGEVCRHDATLHDDMDLSIHLPPQAIVIRDARLTIPISARPVDSKRSMVYRVWRGAYSLAKHYPQEMPINRWMRRARVHYRARTAEPSR
ncbi:MAG: glycosyltransferase family 2 protein [Microcella sp.]